ncbi:MAG: hypothetical protein COT74_08315 [Bdellovibrionales bacterium CG10_big_fil_rev_8_21_14_0_10_45_34]|nr:MAG: hypothetical protein COT74_08315 [Bdellovibrionales bacterium CG10_big_fil_rev_8_21_14_0_10_45_34]
MKHVIKCEHFDLTESIETHVAEHLEGLDAILPAESTVDVILNETNPKVFSALMKVHAWKHDIIASEKGGDLYEMITKASHILSRRVKESKEKIIEERRH